MNNSRTQLDLAGRVVGHGQEVLLIAEVGQAHDGSLGTAHAYIDAAADCGVDAVKFQTHIASEESTSEEKFRVKVFPQDDSRYQYWERTSFSKSQWLELASHARERKLLFLSSPFSRLAVDWLTECDVPAWKIASGELTNYPMLEQICETNKPILISSGMSSWKELEETVSFIERLGGKYGVFQCTTSYPCPPEKWGLNIVTELQDRFRCPVGLSDHSGDVTSSIAAVSLGASMLEFHIAFSKSQFGPDACASLTLPQVSELVGSVRNLTKALSSPIDKNSQAELLSPLHDLFTKSIVANGPLKAGVTIELKDLAYKKPGTGIPAKFSNDLVGRVLVRNVEKDHFFSNADFVS